MPNPIQPHQQRVLDEQTELKDKLWKLEVFLQTAFFQSLSPDERERLSRQRVIMTDYVGVLEERIAAWN